MRSAFAGLTDDHVRVRQRLDGEAALDGERETRRDKAASGRE